MMSEEEYDSDAILDDIDDDKDQSYIIRYIHHRTKSHEISTSVHDYVKQYKCMLSHCSALDVIYVSIITYNLCFAHILKNKIMHRYNGNVITKL